MLQKGLTRTTCTNRTGQTQTYEYDCLDRVVKIIGSQGETKEYTYDATGNVTSATDALGNKTSYEYTLVGELSKVIDALGNEAIYTYNEAGQLIEVKQLDMSDENETLRITRYERDKLGRVIATTNALGQKESYKYNLKGQLVEKLDRDGYLTKYDYNAHGDLWGIEYADGRRVDMYYNPLRQLTEVQDWLGKINIELDPLGRPTKVIDHQGREVSYAWGVLGERRQITYPDGKKVVYNYDELLRLSEVVDGNGKTAYHYDEYSRLIEKLHPSGAKTLLGYNQSNRLQTLSHLEANRETAFDRYQYEYDLLGNKVKLIKERQNLPEDTGVFEYIYDPLSRLQEVIKNKEPLREYTYDGYGNRINLVENINTANHTTSYTYNALNQLISTEDSKNNKQEFHYDQRGNLTEAYEQNSLTQKYYFGALNRLEKAFNHGIGQGASYQYNGLTHRVGRTEGKAIEPVLPTACLSGVSLNPTKQVEDVLDLTKNYHNLLQRIDNQETTSFTWDNNLVGSTTLDGRTSDGGYNHYLLDELGSPIRILDRLGKEQELFGFDEFGNSLIDNNGKTSSNKPFTYTGYQKDGISNTYYAQAREYLPQVGRFTGEDIVKGFAGRPQTINPYLYCLNSPSNYVDLDGRLPSAPPLSPDCVEIESIPCCVHDFIRRMNELCERQIHHRINQLNVDTNVVFDNIFSAPYFRGQTVLQIPEVLGGAMSAGNKILIPRWNGNDRRYDILIHESAHFHGQYIPLGATTFYRYIGVPSMVSSDAPFNQAFYNLHGNDFVTEVLAIFDGLPHYQMPWEVFADIVGGICWAIHGRTEHTIERRSLALWYHEILQMKSPEHPTPLDQNLIDLIMREFAGVNEDACP